MSEASEQSVPTRRQRSSVLLFLRDVVVIILIAILISFLIKTFIVRPFWIPSESMEDTFHVDDRIIVSLFTPEVVPLERGTVVVFEDPGGWLTAPPQQQSQGVFLDSVDRALTFIGLLPEDDHGYLIKRVIGLPGDTVTCCNDFGQMSINGVPIEEPYVLLDDPALPVSGMDFAVTVPEGYVWVMGDNRYHSADSRAHLNGPTGGFVPIDDIVGQASFIMWPADRWQTVESYPDTFALVPDPEPDP